MLHMLRMVSQTKQSWHLQDMRRFYYSGPGDFGIQPFLHVIYSREINKLDSETGESACLFAILKLNLYIKLRKWSTTWARLRNY